MQELQIAGINFKAFDLGGHEIARRVWKDYYAKVRLVSRRLHLKLKTDASSVQVDAIVFLVDALDRDRFSESRKELNDLLSDEALMHVRLCSRRPSTPQAVAEQSSGTHACRCLSWCWATRLMWPAPRQRTS